MRGPSIQPIHCAVVKMGFKEPQKKASRNTYTARIRAVRHNPSTFAYSRIRSRFSWMFGAKESSSFCSSRIAVRKAMTQISQTVS